MSLIFFFFFFNDTATTEIYTLSLHDALPIFLTSPDGRELLVAVRGAGEVFGEMALLDGEPRSADAVAMEECWLLLLQDRKSTRLNSSHANISYAVFCLKKKKKNTSKSVIHVI